MFEGLERRRFLSRGVVGGVLTATGSGGVDTVYASWQNNASTVVVRIYDGNGYDNFTWNKSGSGNTFNSVSLYGGAGNDTLYGAYSIAGFSNSSSALLPLTMNGATGNDTLYGSDAADVMNGGSNDDRVEGRDGADYITGDGGNDTLIGQGGGDYLDGGDGDDTLKADADGNTRDSVVGGLGADSFYVNGYYASPSVIVYYDYFPDGVNGAEGDAIYVTIS